MLAAISESYSGNGKFTQAASRFRRQRTRTHMSPWQHYQFPIESKSSPDLRSPCSYSHSAPRKQKEHSYSGSKTESTVSSSAEKSGLCGPGGLRSSPSHPIRRSRTRLQRLADEIGRHRWGRYRRYFWTPGAAPAPSRGPARRVWRVEPDADVGIQPDAVHEVVNRRT